MTHHEFVPGRSYKVGLLMASTKGAAGLREDKTSARLADILIEAGYEVRAVEIVPDEQEKIAACNRNWIDREELDLVLTSGGTGLSPGDVTPEATAALIERPAPGLVEAIRQASRAITPHAMLSRAAAGIRCRTLIVNLPGSVKAVAELFMPVGGEIRALNEALEESPELVNKEPYDEGWMIEIKLADTAELNGLMSRDDYVEFLKGKE